MGMTYDISRFWYTIGKFTFASKKDVKDGDTELRQYKGAVVAVSGRTEPERMLSLSNGKEGTLQFDLGPAIESEQVFAPRLSTKAGIPVFASHNRRLALGRVDAIYYGEFEGSPALLADISLLANSPDPEADHVLQAVPKGIGAGLSVGMDPATVKYDMVKEDDGEVVVFQSFDVAEVSLTPEPRVPQAHLFSLPKEVIKMSNPIQAVRPEPAQDPARVQSAAPPPNFSAPPPPAGTAGADDAIYTFLETARKDFESNPQTLNSLFQIGEEYRKGAVSATQAMNMAMVAARNHAGVQGLAPNGSSPQGESEHIATRMHDTVPNFNMHRLMNAAMRRGLDPSFNCPELDLMESMHQEFPSWNNVPGMQVESRPGSRTFTAPSHALLELMRSKQELGLGRSPANGFNFAQTYGTSTIGGSTGSAQIGESTVPDYRRDLLQGFLRPSDVSRALGIREVPVTKNIVVPTVTSSTSFGWLGENAATAATGYDVATQESSPKRIGAHGLWSWQLGVSEGADGLGTYQLLMDELNSELALQKELALYAGTAGDGQPRGITNVTGTNAITLSATPTWAQIASYLTPILEANLPSGGATWLTTPRWYQVLRTTLQTTTANSIFLSGNATLGQGMGMGMLDGRNLLITNNIPKIGSGDNEELLMLGVWMYLLSISYAQVFVTIDDVTRATNAATQITIQGFCDILTLRAKAFSIGSAII